MGDSKDVDADMAALSKVEPAPDGTPSSIESTPEQDPGTEPATQEPAQPQKRKGGRKPVSSSSMTRIPNTPCHG